MKYSNEMTGTWQRLIKLKRENKSLLRVTQNNTISNNYIKAKVDNTLENNKHMPCSGRK